jgi:predicted patatin/cPLA2 family phospholipase
VWSNYLKVIVITVNRQQQQQRSKRKINKGNKALMQQLPTLITHMFKRKKVIEESLKQITILSNDINDFDNNF